MRLAYGNDTNIKRRPLKGNVKKEIEGQRDNQKNQIVNHGWLNDKKTWFEHIPEGLKS